jgi:hypothetical protein
MFRKNVASQFIHVQGIDASTGGIKSGVSWTVRRCIDGTFAAATGTATEDGTTGWYKFALSQADTNGNNIGFNFTGTGAVPQTVNIVTTAADPTDSVRLGLTALPNAAAEAAGGLYTRGTGAGQIGQTTNGTIDVAVTRWGGNAVAATSVNGVPIVDVKYFLGTAITEGGAGRVAGAVTKFFDKASPTGTINSLPDVVPGSAGALVIAGTNTPIVFTGSGDAFSAISTGGNGSGINVSGNGTGAGMLATGGTTGAGLKGVGGSSSGHGIHGLGSGNGTAGIFGTCNGIGAGSDGIRGTKGASGTYDIGPVTVGTNNDKTGYSLTQTFPSNFSSLAITAGGAVTVGTISNNVITAASIAASALNGKGDWNIGKTGYSLTAAYDLAKTAAQAGDAMALTSAAQNAAADSLLARNVAGGSSAGRLVKEALYTLRNKVDIAAGTLTVYAVDDVTPAYTATVTTAAGNPISTIDPA